MAQTLDPRSAKAIVQTRSTAHDGENGRPVPTVADIYERMKLYRGRGTRDVETEAAIFRDVERLARALDTFGAVRDALRATPHASDRHIARASGCSPTTVGKLRRELGLSAVPRSVQRRGQTYRMKAGEGTR